ncbi:glycosyltransferase family 4 protein [Pedobacter sp. JY14-1]|uniref:glycosyltransferase family 4 protein n=1 Tax=Pedobacter sp. JY14-1 TaxID=3034151 RepID=UPI0023E22825|nr:glycosyltransferase family 4 protein [Pedobacter sp. JY14-1]
MTKKTLFLTLSTFSSVGGVQSVCRSVCKALSEGNPGFKMISLCDNTSDTRYLQPCQFRGFGDNKRLCKLRFIYAAVGSGQKSQFVIISHIHLIPVALLIKLLNPDCRLVLLAHGTEVWRDLTFYQKWFISKYTRIVSVSRFTSKILRKKHRIDCPVVTINNCLDPHFQLPQAFNKPQYLMERYSVGSIQPVLLTVCRMERYEKAKGYDTVIELVSALAQSRSPLRYLLCGPSSHKERERLQQKISHNGLQEQVILTGHIPETELRDHFLLADIFIMPSSKEGFGLVFIEAAACGCQVIALNSCGSADALLDGAIGTLMEMTDMHQLMKALNHALKNPYSELRKREIQQNVSAHFAFQLYSTKLKEFLYANT